MEDYNESLSPPPQVRHLELPDRQDLRKLQQLREEQGELAAPDERRLKVLQRATEREVLQSADVVCTTCVGAADPRLLNFRFRKVRLIPGAPHRVHSSRPQSCIARAHC